MYLSGGLNKFTGCIPAALFDIDDHDLDELKLEPCGDSVEVGTPVSVQFSEAEYTVNEDAGEVELTVTLTEPLDSPVNVILRTADGTAVHARDYLHVATIVTFPANTTRQTTTVRIVNDQTLEATRETFSASLESIPGSGLAANTSPATITIVDDDEVTVGFQQAVYRISEGRESVVILLEVVSPRISCPTPDPFVVHFSYEDWFGVLIPGPTTTSPVSIPFDRCEVRRALSFQIHNDNVVNRPRWVDFTLDRVTSDTPGVASRVLFGKWSTARLEIIDQSDTALVEFKQSAYRVREGEAVEICAVLRDDDRVEFPFTVDLSYTDRDGALSSGPASFMFGVLETESCVEFEIPHDDNARSDRYFVNLRLERPPDLDPRVSFGRERSTARLEVIDAEASQAISANQFTSVSAGWLHTCGVMVDGSVVCWGYDGFGQATPPEGEFASVSAGDDHTCGVRTDGSVACWGDNEYGQATPSNGQFVSVSAEYAHTCGVRTDGSVACWGNDGFGRSTPPEGEFASVSAGDAHTCGVRLDDSVDCWGWDEFGQAMPPEGEFASVSAGAGHTCGVRTDGSVDCWGGDDFGRSTPPEGEFASVSAGFGHTCGVMVDGAVACWGYDGFGQATPPEGEFASVSAGFDHTCGVRMDGAVACWGDNDSSQATPPEGEFASVSAGWALTTVVRLDGSVVCWGSQVRGLTSSER